MISLSVKAENKINGHNAEILESIANVPAWEMIKEFVIKKNHFYFFQKPLKVQLFKKFSEKLMLDKYLIRSCEGRTLANMDLRIYKDSVYIISLEINAGENAPEAAEVLLRTAIERSADTSLNEVFINVAQEQKHKGGLKKMLVKNGFVQEKNQSSCEQKIFGEIFKLCTAKTI